MTQGKLIVSEELKLKLEELEELSIKISDDISNGDYDNIVQLDLKRTKYN